MASKNGKDGRVYGGDCNLIHVADGKRASAGKAMAKELDYMMRQHAENRSFGQRYGRLNGEFDDNHMPIVVGKQDLCPGCYMVVGFNMLVALADANGQSRVELARSMANAFANLAVDPSDGAIEEIAVLLDPDEE